MSTPAKPGSETEKSESPITSASQSSLILGALVRRIDSAARWYGSDASRHSELRHHYENPPSNKSNF